MMKRLLIILVFLFMFSTCHVQAEIYPVKITNQWIVIDDSIFTSTEIMVTTKGWLVRTRLGSNGISITYIEDVNHEQWGYLLKRKATTNARN